MKASIIVALDSGENFTRNFLYFLSRYESIDEYEVILTSDGNNEIDYSKIIYEYFNDKCIYINNNRKQGYGVTNNIASQYASTDILIFMNADVILEKNCLEAIIAPFYDNEIDAVQPLLIYPQSMTTQSTGHVFCKYYNTHLLENRAITDDIVQQSGYRTAFTTALCAIRTDVFRRYGGFNEKYFNAWEGMELGLKITSNGGKCYYNPSAKAFHIRGGGRGQYKIDETPQTAYFWSQWGQYITENLSEVLNKQINNMIKNDNNNYFLINFSCIREFDDINNKLAINISNSINYTELAGYPKIEFFKTLPYFLLFIENDIVYLANNFKVIKNNKLWFNKRKKHNDMIIDLSGNCLFCK